MALNRLAARRAQRVKVADENATAQGPVLTKRTVPTFPPPGGAQRVPVASKAVPTAAGTQRAALGEVTINHRKDSNIPSKPSQGGANKRFRSSSVVISTTVSQESSQPLPPISSIVNRPPTRVPLASVSAGITNSLNVEIPPTTSVKEGDNDDLEVNMDIEEPGQITRDIQLGMRYVDIASEDEELHKTEVETMVGIEVSQAFPPHRACSPVHPSSPASSPIAPAPASLTESPTEVRPWPAPASPKTHAELQRIRDSFVDDIDEYDTTLVSEYAGDIFAYMARLEEESMPGERYVDGQGEINWEMRQTLVDWLLQVHLRYRLLPETLWIAVNIIDRFLTKRVVSLVKLQLVGVTAMFIAAKYEEILAPSVDEFVFMTENGYQKDEILKGERIILQTLDFRISSYCTPYSWVRKISKADDYDLQTRTLSKFLMEVTLLDYRFLRVKPSMVAAVGMYSARRMLGGDWNEAFIYYSGFTEAQLEPGHNLLIEKLVEPDFDKQYIYNKYLHKKFLKASSFAREWAIRAANGNEANGNMVQA